MKHQILFSLQSLYREELKVEGYRFGNGKRSACVVGAVRGNEYQQLYICSQLIQVLTRLEQAGAILPEHSILIVPSINHFSMNVGKRFWAVDNTDINRMFPGYDQGETTQRVANGVFSKVQNYDYGIHLASFYLPGDFEPHVRMMDTGYQRADLATLFGLPYVVVRKPRPIDTTTLNYNWQLWGTKAFSVYTNKTDCIDEESAKQAVSAILRFFTRVGILRYHSHSGYIASVVKEEKLIPVISQAGGLYRRKVHPGDEVAKGQLLGEILEPFTGEIVATVQSPADGVLFFAHRGPAIMQHTVAFRIIPGIHN